MKLHHFTCTVCGKPWSMAGENPDGHTEVPCPSCVQRIHSQLMAEVTIMELAIPRGYVEVPPELQALKLGSKELAYRMVALREGIPLEKLLGAPVSPLQ